MSFTQSEVERARELIGLESVTEKVTGNVQPGVCIDVLPRCWDYWDDWNDLYDWDDWDH